jgi:hypothetical protein
METTQLTMTKRTATALFTVMLATHGLLAESAAVAQVAPVKPLARLDLEEA